jgi:MFS family permease
MFGNGAISTGFPRFFDPIRVDLGVSYASVALIFGLARAEGGMGGPLVGWMVDRFGSRPMVLFGGLLSGAGLILIAFAHSYWQVLLLFVGMVSVGKTAGLGQTLMSTVNQWFIRRKALAMSTLMTSFAGGGAIVLPLLHLGIQHLGWRPTVFIVGVLIIALTLPVAWVIRSRPEDLGLRPDGDPPQSHASAGWKLDRHGREIDPADFDVRQAIRTSAFWFILLGVVTRVSATNAVIIHLFPILEWRGVDSGAATILASLLFFLAIPLRFVLGVAGGKVSPRKLLFVGMNLGAVALAALWLVPGVAGLIIFIVGLAVVEGVTSVNWIMVGDYFGRSRFASLMGFMSIFHNVGLFLFPIYAGWIRDITGGYTIAMMTFIPMFVLSAFLFALARKPVSPNRVAGTAETEKIPG